MNTPGGRARATWTWHDDYLPLWETLARGDDAIATRLDRTIASIRKRASDITTPTPITGLAGLRKAAASGKMTEDKYRALVAAHHHTHGPPLWDTTTDTTLRNSWTTRHPRLPELAQQLVVTEQHLVDRFITLGLADGLHNVVDHLGATTGGTVDINARIARDNTTTAIWVLLQHTPVGVHVTTHPNEHTARTAATARHLLTGHRVTHWQITQNIAGDPRPRRVLTGTPALYERQVDSVAMRRTPVRTIRTAP